MSIKLKVLSVLAGTMLLAAVATIALWSTSIDRLLEEYVRSFTEQLVDKTENSVLYIIADLEHTLYQVTTNSDEVLSPILQSGEGALSRLKSDRMIMDYIRAIYSAKYYLQGLSVVENDGTVHAAGARAKDTAKLLAELQAAQWETKTRLLSPTPSNMGDFTRMVKIIPLARPIVDYSGKCVGYGVVYFETKLISEMMQLNLPEGSFLQIEDRWGEPLYTNSHKTPITAYAENASYNYYTHETPTLKWNTTIAMPVDEIVGKITPTIVSTGIIYALVYCMALVVVVVFASKITNRILRVSSAMDSVAKGDFPCASKTVAPTKSQ